MRSSRGDNPASPRQADPPAAWLGEPHVRAAGGVVLRGHELEGAAPLDGFAAGTDGRRESDPPQGVGLGAAGGARAGEPQVVVVHRPRYDDWSLPKGKLDEGEGWLDAALWEVEEETGLQCESHEELRSARYFDSKGRRKLVRWWLMRATGGQFSPNDEVDELLWLPLDEAMSTLDYEHDRELIREVRDLRSARVDSDEPGGL